MDSISLLITLDHNYIPQFQVLLTSLRMNNPKEKITIYLLHNGLSHNDLKSVHQLCAIYQYTFVGIYVKDSIFQGAPVTQRYPKEIYYRLLAGQLLPESVKKVLYLDSDILVINPIRSLWEMDINNNIFAAAAHSGKTKLMTNVNQLRLKTEHDYYNSGVLLINLERARQEIKPQQLFQYVEQHRKELILPDQDILNALYGHRILPLEDVIWNYDARNYSEYLFCSGGLYDWTWIIKNTAILHFCGKEKPWKSKYSHRFGILYQHYQQITQRTLNDAEKNKQESCRGF